MGRLIDDIALVEAFVKELEILKMQYYLTIANTGDEKLDFAYKEVGNALIKQLRLSEMVV